MHCRLFITTLVAALTGVVAEADDWSTFPFVDGLWHGGIETHPDSAKFERCWASTTFDDGSTFELAERRGAIWSLRLTNPHWHLAPSRRYDVKTLVDFYPRLRVAAEAESKTLLVITDLGRTAMLGFIENGHTITMASEGIDVKYDLEGSAKVIQRIRHCFEDQSAGP